jgi:hypothetical protein
VYSGVGVKNNNARRPHCADPAEGGRGGEVYRGFFLLKESGQALFWSSRRAPPSVSSGRERPRSVAGAWSGIRRERSEGAL